MKGRPEARWASSNAHRPGAALLRCCDRKEATPSCKAAPAVRGERLRKEAQRARGRSVAAKAPRSGIGRFACAWIARWLQKSGRSILSRRPASASSGISRFQGDGGTAPMTSAARRPLPRRGSESDSRRAEGCGTECAFIMNARVAPLGESRASIRWKAPRTTESSP